MASVLESLPRGARVTVIRMRSLGDCVLTTPALAILKQSRPDLQIGVVVEDRFAAVFEGSPDVAAILAPSAAAVKQWGGELCLNLHGGTRSATLTALSRARLRAGFAHFRAAPLLYNVRIPTAQQILGVDRKVHTAEHLASAIFHLGAPVQEIPRARLSAEPRPAGSPYAVIHAMASAPEKTWPAENFLAVARHLRSERELEPVFIAGAEEELGAFQAYRRLAGAPLADVKSLLAGASLFIGNDSGPAHMAAAFGVPVVVLFGSSDPVVWAPWKTASVVLTGSSGIASIEAARVLEAMDRWRVRA